MPIRAPPVFECAGMEQNSQQKAGKDEEDDYMAMVIEEPKNRRETYAQKKMRLQRESEAKARVPSKAEREAAEAARREAALSTSTLDPSSKGFKMMAKLGYKPGTALGKPEDDISSGSQSPVTRTPATAATTAAENEWRNMQRRLLEPLGINVKEDRGGIGLDSEKKRKFREEVEAETKRVRADEGDYRERVRLEREERRKEGQFHAAQKVAERLDSEAEEREINQVEGQPPEGDKSPDDGEPARAPKRHVKQTSQINILYRGLVRAREKKLQELQAKHRRYDSLSSKPNRFFSDMTRLPTYDDSTLDPDDKLALSRTVEGDIAEVELEEDEEDEELEAFNELSADERLTRVVAYLRDKHHYCFWCKYQYESAEMEGCPGLTEEDHD